MVSKIASLGSLAAWLMVREEGNDGSPPPHCYVIRPAVHAYEITTQFGVRVHGRGLGSLPVVLGGVATPFLRLQKYGRGREINGREHESTAGVLAYFQWGRWFNHPGITSPAR